MKLKHILLAAIISLSTAPLLPEVAPEACAQSATEQVSQADGYYYNYKDKQIKTVRLRIKRRRVVAYWEHNVWINCSERVLSNKKGDEADDIPEEWARMSKSFDNKAVINGITLYFTVESNGGYGSGSL